MMTPVWRCPVEYRQLFEVSSVGFRLDATHLDGKEVFWDDFGGLPKYLDLLEYCQQQVASSTESDSSDLPMTLESRPEALQTNADPMAAIRRATADPQANIFSGATGPAATGPAEASPAAPMPVLAGATIAAGPSPLGAAGTQQQLPIAELFPRGLDPTPTPGPASDSAAAFVSDRGVVAPEAMIIAGELYENYLTWCLESGREPLSQRGFGMRLTGLGFDRKRRARGRHWWVGLGLAER